MRSSGFICLGKTAGQLGNPQFAVVVLHFSADSIGSQPGIAPQGFHIQLQNRSMMKKKHIRFDSP
jgi:hypothetical protein